MESLHPLDNPVFASLTGPQARFAIRRGNVLFYPADVSPFFVLPRDPSAADWADVAVMVGPGGIVPLAGVDVPPPAGWAIVMTGEGVQFVDDGVAAAPDPEAIRLDASDVPEMLALVETPARSSSADVVVSHVRARTSRRSAPGLPPRIT